MILASSLITLCGLVAGTSAGISVVIRREDATSVALARVFETELAHVAIHPAGLLELLRDEIAEQSAFGRQVEVWRAETLVAAGPRASFLHVPWPDAGSCATMRIEGALWRLCATSISGGLRIAIALPLEPLVNRVGSFALAVAVSTLLAILAFAAVSRKVVQRTLRPFEELQRAVDALDGARKESRVGDAWGLVEAVALAKAFDAMLSRIEAATARERQFLFDVSHELRTPLACMRAQLELARGTLPAESEAMSRLAAAEVSCLSLIHVTESVLALVRDELPRGETINLADIVRALVKDRFEDVGRLRVEAEDEVLVCADNELVALAVGNLIDNALKFSTGEVTVCVRVAGGAGLVAVTDTGPGIPAGELSLVLEPFFRGRAARGSSRGTGLGLPLAKHVASAYGGNLGLENVSPSGVKASFVLPCWKAD